MEKRRAQRTVMMRAVVIMLLFLFAFPSCSAQQGRAPQVTNPKLRDRLGLDKPREPNVWEIEEARERQIRQIQEERRNRSIIRKIYDILTDADGMFTGPPDTSQIAGTKDYGGRHVDRGYSGSGYEHLAIEEATRLNEERLGLRPVEPIEFGTPEGKKRMDALRARAAAQRAKRELKAAQKLAQVEKKAADEQAAMAAGAQQSSGCFPRDIRVVMADGTARSIADVKPGDVVMTYDIGYDEIVGKPVAAAYSVRSNHLYTVNDDLETTGGERLLTQSGWKPLMALTERDLAHVNGWMTGVDTIEYKRVNLTTYNLQVNDTHNFYVETEAGNAYLVHNCGGGGK
ncbi:MAG: Hint domain-containing protein [Desulfatiglandaceae bacterium]